MMCLDECLSLPASYADTERSIQLTERWALRSKQARVNDQSLFGIVQGASYPDLRLRSLEGLVNIGFDGYAIGGLSVGESKEVLYEITRYTAPLLPKNQPRYLMGVGEPEDLLEAIDAGVDLFDCVLPTRNARNGCLFTSQGKVSIKQSRYTEDPNPLDPHCACYVCQNYSNAYLRHLFMTKELLSMSLNTYHNLFFYLSLVQQARIHILSGTFASFKKSFLESYRQGEPNHSEIEP